MSGTKPDPAIFNSISGFCRGFPSLRQIRVMGGVFSRLRCFLFGPMFCRVLMVGLHNAGKSTVLCKLKSGDVEAVTRTTGFNVETVDYRDVSFTIWDIGGNQKVRHIWKHYYVNVKATIFVVDSSDNESVCEACKEILDLLAIPDLQGTALLILANKQDVGECMTADEITTELKLQSIKDREQLSTLRSNLNSRDSVITNN
ncbi:hypothetical protein RB195_013571 [Necator americanus]|uniref:ADP-ribosylation factor family protein n=1 Tax=Necator americanus TaxID=51031 RepID=A0ABR1DXC3_NECAM